MTDPKAVPDEAIAAMLQARSDRLLIRLEPAAAVADAIRDRQVRRGLSFGASWLGAGVAVVVLALIAAAIVIAPPRPGPVASAVASGSPSPVASAVADGWDARAPLTAAQLGELVRTRSVELDGRLAVVHATLATETSACGLALCEARRFVGLDGSAVDGLTVRVALDPGKLTPVNPTTLGSFVVRFSADVASDGPVVDVLGTLAVTEPDGWTASVHGLLAANSGLAAPGVPGDLAAVDGWLVRSAPDCPISLALRPPPCTTRAYLTDESFQPVLPRLQVRLPDQAILVQDDAYERFAPDPQAIGDDGSVRPRHAIYVIRNLSQRCGNEPGAPASDLCATGQSEVVGVIAPIGPAAEATPEPSPSASAAAMSLAGVIGWTPPEGTEVVVSGWLVGTPALRCRGVPPVSGPDYSCGEYDVLTTTPIQIWQADGFSGSLRLPDAFVRVQNGAYQRFAPDPLVGQFGVAEPRFGTFRIRAHIGSMCASVELQSGEPCVGGAAWNWEILERLDAAGPGPSVIVEPVLRPTPSLEPGTTVHSDPESCPSGAYSCL